MGSARWSQTDWNTHSQTTQKQTRAQIFTQSGMHKDLDPKGVTRESVDSDLNPASTSLILGADGTGSMGVLAEVIIKHGLGTIMGEVYTRKPITDPHILCAAIGDAKANDPAPLQVTQFEAGVAPITEQVKNIWMEGMSGGGNGGESYGLLYYFAQYKVVADCIQKRKRKGFLFTIGDECCHPIIDRSEISRVFGDNVEADVKVSDLLSVLTQNWHVFHLIVKPEAYQPVVASWTELLGERAIQVSDHARLAEVIVSTIQVVEGHDMQKVVGSWDGKTALVVGSAIRGLAKSSDAGVQRL